MRRARLATAATLHRQDADSERASHTMAGIAALALYKLALHMQLARLGEPAVEVELIGQD